MSTKRSLPAWSVRNISWNSWTPGWNRGSWISGWLCRSDTVRPIVYTWEKWGEKKHQAHSVRGTDGRSRRKLYAHRLSLVGNLWNDRFCVLRLELVHLLKQQFMCDGIVWSSSSSCARRRSAGAQRQRRQCVTVRPYCALGHTRARRWKRGRRWKIWDARRRSREIFFFKIKTLFHALITGCVITDRVGGIVR